MKHIDERKSEIADVKMLIFIKQTFKKQQKIKGKRYFEDIIL